MNDAQLIKFATSFRRGILGREASDYACFMVCAPLAPLLEMNGLNVQVRTGQIPLEGAGSINHYWIELEDGRVLDPTADQFNKWFGEGWPKVYLGPALEIHPLSTGEGSSDG